MTVHDDCLNGTVSSMAEYRGISEERMIEKFKEIFVQDIVNAIGDEYFEEFMEHIQVSKKGNKTHFDIDLEINFK